MAPKGGTAVEATSLCRKPRCARAMQIRTHALQPCLELRKKSHEILKNRVERFGWSAVQTFMPSFQDGAMPERGRSPANMACSWAELAAQLEAALLDAEETKRAAESSAAAARERARVAGVAAKRAQARAVEEDAAAAEAEERAMKAVRAHAHLSEETRSAQQEAHRYLCRRDAPSAPSMRLRAEPRDNPQPRGIQNELPALKVA